MPHPAATGATRALAPEVPHIEPASPGSTFDPAAASRTGPVGVSHAEPLPDFLNFAAQETDPSPAGTFNQQVPRAGFASNLTQIESSPIVAADEPTPRRRVRRRNMWAMVLPIAALALAVGGGLAFMIVRMTALEGELTAEPLTGELPRVAIDKIYVDVSDMRQLQDRLSKEPLRMQNGPLTEMNVAASEGKLWVSIIVSPEGAIYRVDPRQNPRFSKYIEKHRLLLDRQRGEDLVRDGPLFLVEIQRLMKEAGSPSKLMQQFFQTIGVATLVKGLGYHAWADRSDPCVYEDPEGRLYFVLPKGTTKFELTGRDNLSSGHQKFLGRFQVNVSGASVELPPVPPLPRPKSGKEKAGKKTNGEPSTSETDDPNKEPPGMADEPEKNEKPKKKKILLKDD